MNSATKPTCKLDSIAGALMDMKSGKVVMVVDDADRENEGDFITAAQNTTPEIFNFMITHGRGVVCASITGDRCAELQLPLMVSKNTSLYATAFTVSVDLLGRGCTTGVSAHDRAKTIRALADPSTKPTDLGRPGHIFPLQAAKNGVLERAGHTEAAVDLPRLAGMKPAGVLVEIINQDGTMARLPDLFRLAEEFGIKIISIEDLIQYRKKNDK